MTKKERCMELGEELALRLLLPGKGEVLPSLLLFHSSQFLSSNSQEQA